MRKDVAAPARRTEKRAAIGGEQETGFEQSFASLAYAYLKDKSPRLLDFIIGFQLVDRNNDNTRAVGLFGFKVGDQWLYGPVFFLNGELKGHELLYVKNQDSFVPMKENWVNNLISRRPHVLGGASPQDSNQLGAMHPNLSRMVRPGGGVKFSADAWTGWATEGRCASWARPFLPFYAAMATGAEGYFPKAACDGISLDRVLADLPGLLPAAQAAYHSYPLVKAGFDRFYGPGFLEKAAAVVKKARSYLLPPAGLMRGRGDNRRLRPKTRGPLIDVEPKEDPVKEGSLQVFVLDPVSGSVRMDGGGRGPSAFYDPYRDFWKFSEDVDHDAPGGVKSHRPELDEAEREKLLKDHVLIKDERDSHATSVAYDTQVQVSLTNPDATGLYRVLEKPGEFDEMLVVAAPFSGRGQEDFAVVVRKSDPRAWVNTHRSNVWVNQHDAPMPSDFKDYVSGLSDVGDLSEGSTYVLVSESGQGTCPFTVTDSYGDGTYKVSWKDYCLHGDPRPGGMRSYAHRYDSTYDYMPWDSVLRVSDRRGSKPHLVRGELSVPDSFKALRLKEPAKPSKGDMFSSPCCDEAESDPPPIRPGNLADVQVLLTEKRASGELTPLSVRDLGAGEAFVKSRGVGERMTKSAALVGLVRDHGLSEGQARAMLKAASAAAVHNGAVNYLIKYADQYNSLFPGPGAPAFPEPYLGSEQAGPSSYRAIYPQEENVPVDEVNANSTDPSIYDPFYRPDPDAMRVAQSAAQSGQKEVFDTAMVSGLLKAVRQDSLVDRYLGDLMKALDKLGRILFMFYWHQEEFEDRYGKQDLPELEDSLRNAFEVLGDVVLFLKEKTVAGGAGFDMLPGSEGAASEPSVTEAARN